MVQIGENEVGPVPSIKKKKTVLKIYSVEKVKQIPTNKLAKFWLY